MTVNISLTFNIVTQAWSLCVSGLYRGSLASREGRRKNCCCSSALTVFWIKHLEMKIYHTVNRLRSFLSSCHLVIRSSGHLDIFSSGYQVIQSSSHPVIQSFIHSFIPSFGHLIIWSSCQPVIPPSCHQWHPIITSFGHLVIPLSCNFNMPTD